MLQSFGSIQRFFFPPPVNQHSRKYLFKTFYSIVICKWASASNHREWRMVKFQTISMLRCLANCLSSWSCLTFHFQGELKPSLGSELCLKSRGYKRIHKLMNRVEKWLYVTAGINQTFFPQWFVFSLFFPHIVSQIIEIECLESFCLYQKATNDGPAPVYQLVGVTMGTMVLLVSQFLLLVMVMVKLMKVRMTMMVILISVYQTCSICIFGVECFSRYPADHSVHIFPLILTRAIWSKSSYHYRY